MWQENDHTSDLVTGLETVLYGDIEDAVAPAEIVAVEDFEEIVDEWAAEIEDSLDVTWSVLHEVPGFDAIYEKAGASLDDMFNRYNYRPFVDWDGAVRLYLCRYEFKKQSGAFVHPDGVLASTSDATDIFLDFLTGFPIDCVELLFMVGEYSSIYSQEEQTSFASEGVTPPVPDSFFEGYKPERILMDYTALDKELDPTYSGVYLSDTLGGTPEPENVKWWCRTNVKVSDKFPIPGEFVGMGVRMMPGEFYGEQKSSPFLYSGNWIDYVFYTSGEVLAVYDDGHVPMLTVRWRKETLEIAQSDYAVYEVGDRVTILKSVEEGKASQTWEDPGAETANPGEWVVAPFMFYGLEYGEV